MTFGYPPRTKPPTPTPATLEALKEKLGATYEPKGAAVAAAAGKLDKTTADTIYTSQAAAVKQWSTRPTNNWAVALGDSNTANPTTTDLNSGAGRSQSTGWFELLCMLSKGRIQHGGTFARAGYTTAQVRDAKLASVFAADVRPGACFINLGTNDVNAGAQFNLAAATAAYVDIITQLRAAGIVPIVCLPLPPNPVMASNDQIWRKRLRDLAAYYNSPIVDFGQPMIDPATGGIKTAYQQDVLHANALGRRVMASAALAQGIDQLFPTPMPMTSKSAVDPFNLIPSGNGMDLNAGSGWINIGDTANGSGSTVAPDPADKLVGNWVRLTYTGTGTFNRNTSTITPATPPPANAQCEIVARLKTTGIETAKAGGGAPELNLRVVVMDSASTVLSYNGIVTGTNKFEVDIDGLVRVTFRWPTNGVKFRIEYGITGTNGTPVTMHLGEVTVRNFDALGTYVPA